MRPVTYDAQCQIVGWLVNSELARILQEIFLVWFDELSLPFQLGIRTSRTRLRRFAPPVDISDRNLDIKKHLIFRTTYSYTSLYISQRELMYYFQPLIRIS